ncbi:hypothetical protein GQ607_016947, partial [Colletotrichum asianum]
FLITKKDSNIKLINLYIKFNKISIKDTFFPPKGNKFSKDFTNYKIISLLNLFSKYN